MGKILSPQEAVERLIIKALAGQTTNLQEWQDSAAGLLASVGSDGRFDLRERIRVRGGSPAEGKVLTSDNDGLARWEHPVPRYATLAKMGL